jgi:hypothetical protein
LREIFPAQGCLPVWSWRLKPAAAGDTPIDITMKQLSPVQQWVS